MYILHTVSDVITFIYALNLSDYWLKKSGGCTDS